MRSVKQKQRQDTQALPPNRKGQKPKGRNVGKLMKILDVPMDVFFEIASYLHPMDILQLARASTDLRKTLLSRSSRHVWIVARRNVDPPLPHCPDFLSEPAYAYLVFERFCESCGAGGVTKVDYALQVRLCGTCWNEKVKRGYELAKEMGLEKDQKALRVIYNLLPKANCKWIRPEAPWLNGVEQKPRNLFCEQEFVRVITEYLDLRDKGDAEALEKFIEGRTNITLDMLTFHRKVIEWGRDVRTDRCFANRGAEEERKHAIEQKLLELGWKRVDWPHGYGWGRREKQHPFYDMLCQPRPLTERIWHTIRPKLVHLLEQERLDREIEQFEQKWHTRRAELSGHYQVFLRMARDPQQQHILPAFRDALDLPCMHALLISKDPNEGITLEDLTAIEPTILVEAERYRDKVHSNLVKVWLEKLAECERQQAPVARIAEADAPGPSIQEKQKGKKKAEPADEPELAMEPSAQVALLNEPTTAFSCSRPGWHWLNDCDISMSYMGIVEHWRAIHSDVRCSDAARPLRNGDLYRSCLPRLLDALGLDGKTTHAELHELITSGRPVCSCGKDPWRYTLYVGKVPKYAVLDVLILHVSRAHEHPHFQLYVAAGGATGEAPVHNITFKPFDEGWSL